MDILDKLKSQIGDDVQYIFDHEALFKAARDEITALRARLEAVEGERDQLAKRVQDSIDIHNRKAWEAAARAERADAALATARRDAIEDARPTDREISDLAYRMWSIHPREIAEQGYEHVSRGGNYENPRWAWYADQIKSVFNAAAIRALANEVET